MRWGPALVLGLRACSHWAGSWGVHSGVLNTQGWELFVHQLMRSTIHIVLHGMLTFIPVMRFSEFCR